MMAGDFLGNGLPVLIGSLPMADHCQAMALVLEYTPEIPLWVQLPHYPEEGMMRQFLPGMPGYLPQADKACIDSTGSGFDDELVAFYQEYMQAEQGETPLSRSRFAMTPGTARGFFAFLDAMGKTPTAPCAVKGQITGPITFATGVCDPGGRAIFYDPQARDAAVKLLAMKARWQAQQMRRLGVPRLLFLDEPALAGFGSSAFISISKEEVAACFQEVIAAIHAEGALAGIHVCANTDWSLIFDSPADILSFDAYAYFDKLMLYKAPLLRFLEAGKQIAWGIVPTLDPDDIQRETVDSLAAAWRQRAAAISAIGVRPETVLAQSLITPACGTGSLSLTHAHRVLELTRGVSARIRETA